MGLFRFVPSLDDNLLDEVHICRIAGTAHTYPLVRCDKMCHSPLETTELMSCCCGVVGHTSTCKHTTLIFAVAAMEINIWFKPDRCIGTEQCGICAGRETCRPDKLPLASG